MTSSARLSARELISKRNIYLLTGVLVGLLLIGSFFDYAISQSLYNPNNAFGIFFAAYGEAPSYLAWAASGTLLLRTSGPRTGLSTALQVAGGLLILVSAAEAVYLPTRYLTEVSPIVIALVGVALIALVSTLTWQASREADIAVVRKLALVLFLVVFLELVVVNLIKIVWERPRMRLMEEYPAIDFSPWWSIGSTHKETLVLSGVSSDEFKSFPSSHTANAATAMLFTAFATLKDSLRRHATLILWVGAAWGGIVALSRIIMGAHFLSDVTVGFTVTFVIMLAVYQVMFRSPEEKDPVC